MRRRELLEWLSRAMGIAVAAIIGFPGIRFITASARTDDSESIGFQRLKRLRDLSINKPFLAPVVGRKQDAWVQSEQQVLGRVWLVRREGAGDSAVQAFNSVCPHMGCQIQTRASGDGFVCPCHRAAFGLGGERQTNAVSRVRNHAPRDMDELSCRIVRDPDSNDEWVEVKFDSFELGLERRVTRS